MKVSVAGEVADVYQLIAAWHGDALYPDHYTAVLGTLDNTVDLTVYFPVGSGHEQKLQRISEIASRSELLRGVPNRMKEETRRHLVLVLDRHHPLTPALADAVYARGGRPKKNSTTPATVGVQFSDHPARTNVVEQFAQSIPGLVVGQTHNPAFRILSAAQIEEPMIPDEMDRPDFSPTTRRHAMRIYCRSSFCTDAEVLHMLKNADMSLASVRCRVVSRDVLEMFILVQDASWNDVDRVRRDILNTPEVNKASFIPMEDTHQHVQIVTPASTDVSPISTAVGHRPFTCPHLLVPDKRVIMTSSLPGPVAQARRIASEGGLMTQVNGVADGQIGRPPRKHWAPYPPEVGAEYVQRMIQEIVS